MIFFIMVSGCLKRDNSFKNKLIVKRQNNGAVEWEDRYLLSKSIDRKGRKVFTVTLSFNFVSSEKIGSYSSLMLESINSCLKRVNPFLTGPNDERMKIIVKGKNIGELEAQNVNIVQITAQRNPYNTFSFLNYNCPVLIHEIIHFLGIEDEYPAPGFNCRPESVKESLFMEMHTAFRASGIPLIWMTLKVLTRSLCLTTTKRRDRCENLKKYFSKNEQLIDSSNEKKVIQIFNEPSPGTIFRESLLLPRQFEAIVYDSDEHKGAHLYRKCTKYVSDLNCGYLPSECKSKEWLFKKDVKERRTRNESTFIMEWPFFLDYKERLIYIDHSEIRVFKGIEKLESSELVKLSKKVREGLGLDDLLNSLGTPHLVGSAAMDLMVWHDLDLTVEVDKQIEKLYRSGTELSKHPNIRQITLRDDTGKWNVEPEKYPDGVYWGIDYRDENLKWKIDIWFVEEIERQPDINNLKDFMPRLTPETREAILNIKRAWFDKPQYGNKVTSYLIYDAVLNEGVFTVEEFDKFLIENRQR